MTEHMHTEDTRIFADICFLKGIFDDDVARCMTCQRVKRCQSPYEEIIVVGIRSFFVKISCNGVSYSQRKGNTYRISCL